MSKLYREKSKVTNYLKLVLVQVNASRTTDVLLYFSVDFKSLLGTKLTARFTMLPSYKWCPLNKHLLAR